METRDILDRYIYPNLDRMEALRELNPQHKGNYILLDCPNCKKREAYIYKSGVTIHCNRNNKCGYSQSIWDYIQITQGMNNQETLLELARLSNYELPKREYDFNMMEEYQKKSNFIEIVNSFFKSQLWEQEGRETLEYLRNHRGYTDEEIRFTELGHNPGIEKTRNYLKTLGYSEEDLKNTLNLFFGGYREEHRLTFPYRDPGERIKTIWGRLTRQLNEGETEEKKYMPFGKTDKSTPFNFTWTVGGKYKDLILVEGFMDALITTARGIPGVVAMGSSNITEKQLELLIKYKPRFITLCFDGDKAGQDGIEKNLEKLTQAGITTLIVTLPDDEATKDPDGYIKEKGISAFRNLLEDAQTGGTWKARRLIEKHNKETAKGKETLIREAFEFEGKIPNRRAREGEEFLRVIAEATGYNINSLMAEREGIEERKARELELKELNELYNRGVELTRKGELKEAREHFFNHIQFIRSKAITHSIEPYTYDRLIKEARETPTGLKTGYECLDKAITVPTEAITIVAGRPSHGKTTFLMNLFLNMIHKYTQKSFFFFSYEETRQQIAFKLINILSKDVINEKENNLEQIRRYCIGGSNRPKIEEGKKVFQELTESRRLWIIGENFSTEELVNNLAFLYEKNDVGAVFIDYIQKIKSNGKFGTRQLEIQDVSNKILEASKTFSIPIILGAQFGRDKTSKDRKTAVRLDNLREAGDIEQDANLVLGLWNESMEKAIAEEEKVKERVVNLEVVTLKNRNGIVNEVFTLEFDRPILTIKEKK